MPTISKELIESILSDYQLPYLETDLLSGKMVKDISINDGLVKVDLELGIPIAKIQHTISEELGSIIKHQTTAEDVLINISSKIKSHAVQKNVTALKGVKNVIAVGSGKGGVGKSTIAVNLALALKSEGAKVGMMDADIYGPSLPTMLGCQGKAPSNDGKTLEPLVAHGIQCISMGHMLDSEDAPVIWRAPMAVSALQQLLNDSNWDDLDYLIIDLPPGTGDIQLSLSQNIPVTGAIIVTTPQDISLIDANKALKMFEKVSIPVLGVIENMSTHICSSCGHEEAIFGSGGGETMSKRYGVPLLGQIPLTKEIRENVDQGEPTVAYDPESPVTVTFTEIARHVAAAISKKPKDFTTKMPKIVFENK